MLVLSRKKGQTIQINDQITITITQIKGQQVRVGVEAPREVAIRRGELCDFQDSQSGNRTGKKEAEFMLPRMEIVPDPGSDNNWAFNSN